MSEKRRIEDKPLWEAIKSIQPRSPEPSSLFRNIATMTALLDLHERVQKLERITDGDESNE